MILPNKLIYKIYSGISHPTATSRLKSVTAFNTYQEGKLKKESSQGFTETARLMPLVLQSCPRIFSDLRFMCYWFLHQIWKPAEISLVIGESIESALKGKNILCGRTSFSCRICDISPWMKEEGAGMGQRHRWVPVHPFWPLAVTRLAYSQDTSVDICREGYILKKSSFSLKTSLTICKSIKSDYFKNHSDIFHKHHHFAGFQFLSADFSVSWYGLTSVGGGDVTLSQNFLQLRLFTNILWFQITFSCLGLHT